MQSLQSLEIGLYRTHKRKLSFKYDILLTAMKQKILSMVTHEEAMLEEHEEKKTLLNNWVLIRIRVSNLTSL